MKILFIYPNLYAQIGFNYGVSFLSAVLKQDGHETALLNINEKLGYPLDVSRIIDDVRAFSPSLIALSAVTNQFQHTLKIASEIRKHVSVPLVCGGIHVTMAPDEVIATGLLTLSSLAKANMPSVTIFGRLSMAETYTPFPIPGITKTAVL